MTEFYHFVRDLAIENDQIDTLSTLPLSMNTHKVFNSNPSHKPSRPCRSLTVQFDIHDNCISVLTRPQLDNSGAIDSVRNVKVQYIVSSRIRSELKLKLLWMVQKKEIILVLPPTTHSHKDCNSHVTLSGCWWHSFTTSNWDFLNKNDQIGTFSRIPFSINTQKVFNSDPSHTPCIHCRSLTVQFHTHDYCISMLTRPQLDTSGAIDSVQKRKGII